MDARHLRIVLVFSMMKMTKFIKQAAIGTLLLTVAIGLASVKSGTPAFKPPGDEVDFSAAPANKNAIFSAGESIVYSVNINNNLDSVQNGKVTYRILTEKNKFVAEDSVKVKIGSNGTKQLDISMPKRTAGFYKIMLMINVTDYDDTIRRAFGVDPDKITSKFAKPGDFDQFWADTKAELAAIKPEYKVTLMPDSTRDNRNIYLVEMKSLGNITVRGWLSLPKTTIKNKKFDVILGLPGYQVTLNPSGGLDPDMAIFYLNVRGQGNSKDAINTTREGYIVYGLDNKNKYVMRGAIMDCIRAVDFIYSRKDLDHDRILVTGGSMGGYLCAALAGLDDRVALYSAQNPILCDIRNLAEEVNWPFYDMKQFVKTRPGLTFDQVLDNLDYFDAKNFAAGIHRPILVGMGFLDPLAPPPNEYVFYNNIHAKDKKLMSYADLGHEVPKIYGTYQGKWMRDEFGMF
jgi:cephalosporin-C deacetylase-like acetyl esterase